MQLTTILSGEKLIYRVVEAESIVNHCLLIPYHAPSCFFLLIKTLFSGQMNSIIYISIFHSSQFFPFFFQISAEIPADNYQKMVNKMSSGIEQTHTLLNHLSSSNQVLPWRMVRHG